MRALVVDRLPPGEGVSTPCLHTLRVGSAPCGGKREILRRQIPGNTLQIPGKRRILRTSTPALTLSTYGHLFDEAQIADDEDMAEAVMRARHDAISASASARPTDPAGL